MLMKFSLFLLFFLRIGYSQPDVPELKNWATDLTNTLTAEQLNSIDNRLRLFQDSTSNQVVLLMIPALNDYPLEDYSYEVAQKNKIGTKEHDNGILLLIVKNDRKIRIEVGYGLEGALPDALSSSIIRNVIIPYFKNDNYYAGITAGINAIISAIKGEYKAEQKPESRNKGIPHLIPFFIILFFIFRFLFRGKRKGGGFIFFPGGFGGSSSGGLGGGSFGGFSGGGGSFGGGGASGSW